MRKLTLAMTGLVSTVLLSGQAFANPAEGGNGFAVPYQSWEHLWNEVIMDITIIGVIMAVAAVVFCIKYKASSPDEVGTAKELDSVQSIAYALIPAAIFMADDFYLAANGWSVWNEYRRVPESAMEIKVTAYQWYFEYEYPDGTTTEEVVLPHNQPVVFRMTSEDVIHSFGLPFFRVKEDVMPGRMTYIYVNPVEIKETLVVCAEFCGNDHSVMYNKVSVVPQAQFNLWLAKMAAEG